MIGIHKTRLITSSSGWLDRPAAAARNREKKEEKSIHDGYLQND
jgi:hypothetical protein